MRRLFALAVLIGLAGCVGAPVGQPVVYGQPPGYPPAPTAGYQPGPARTDVAYGGTCYAGVYTCALLQALPVGSQCSCPGLGAPSFGSVR